MSVSTLVLTTRDRRSLSRLIGLLQTHLESAIKSSIILTLPKPMPAGEYLRYLMEAEVDTESAPDIKKDRRDWRTAEEWQKRLEAA